MKYIKNFKEDTNKVIKESLDRESMFAIYDAFNRVNTELNLLNDRFNGEGDNVANNDELNMIGDEIKHLKESFDNILERFKMIDK